MTPMDASYRFLRDNLCASSSLNELLGPPPVGRLQNIFSDNAPQGVVPPYVLFEFITGISPTMIQTNVVAINQLMFQVKGVIIGRDQSAAQAIADEINMSIDQVSSSDYGGFMINCYKSAEFSTSAQFVEKDYRQAGARYTVLVRPIIP